MRRFLLLCVLPVFLLAACGPEPLPLPTGPQRIQGVLERAPLSRIRRGTHLLRLHGEPLYLVESATVNLGPLEGKEVELEGIIEANTDPEALPVLVMQRVLKGGVEQMRRWVIKSQGISLSVPHGWDASFANDEAIFTASGSLTAMLRIRGQAVASLPFSFDAPTASPGTLVTTRTIDRKRAVIFASDREWVVFVDRGGVPARALSLRFSLGSPEEQELVGRVIETLHFEGSSSARTGTGAVGNGQPCGGSAGILCPSGSYCQVTDLATGVGRCAKL